jgi:PAT family beta-lactamase induction signal transducer AmpG|tara:strand:+ start:597 stop:1943 length:1347 start_codon:yes stop_codon:yes gene_type:complete
LRVNSPQRWLASIAIYWHPRIVALFFLGFSAGLPFLLVFSTMSAWLTENGVSRSTIGFFSWVGITYSVKVFWAPVVDRIRLPGLGRLGQRRSWMLVAQLGICAGLFGLSIVDPDQNLHGVAVLALVVAFASATQDISVDAYRIEAAEMERQAAMAAAYIFGYRVALLVAGAGALLIAEFSSWSMSYAVMAGLVSVGVITTCIIQEPEHDASIEPPHSNVGEPRRQRIVRWFRSAVAAPFHEFFARHGWLALVLLGVIATYRISDITMGVMANPFYLDLGFSKAEIASIVKAFGFSMTLAGAVLGGIFVVRFGLMRMMLTGAIMVALTNLLFALMAELAPTRMLLAMVISADNLSAGVANVVFVAFLSNLVNKTYTATQYALFSSVMTLLGKFIGGFAGVVVDGFGYTMFFLYAAGIGIPAMLLVFAVMRFEIFSDPDLPKVASQILPN